jgi:hypothetical protein
VLLAERHADGLAGPGDLEEFPTTLSWPAGPGWGCAAARAAQLREALSAAECAAPLARRAVLDWDSQPVPPEGHPEEPHQCDLWRDIFGNPFCPVALDPAWLTGEVLALAEAAYQERLLPSGQLDPARLAVLADALEEAGAGGELLTHLRSAGPHVRGCWAVDLLAGRSEAPRRPQ